MDSCKFFKTIQNYTTGPKNRSDILWTVLNFSKQFKIIQQVQKIGVIFYGQF